MTQEAISFVTSEIFKEGTDVPTSVSSTPQKLKNKHLVERFLRESDSTRSLLLWLENSNHSLSRFDKVSVLPFLIKAIEEIDRQLEQQINTIIHHASFQALEASWRGILYIVNQQEMHDKDQKVKVKLLDCCWLTLSKDINRAIEFDQSEFFKLIYNNEYDMSGGEPFGALIGDYQMSHKNRPGVSTNDIDVLKDISRTAAAAFAPFITSASPSLFGADDFTDLSAHMNIGKIFEQHEYLKWNSLRKMDDARFIGLTLPNILMRSPYLIDGTRSEGFKFKESIKNPNQDHLWGNAAYAFGGIIIRSFSDSGWFGHIRGLEPGARKKGLVCDLAVCQYETDLYRKRNKPSVDLLVSDRAEKALSDQGFIPLSPVSGCEHLVFYSNASIQEPPKYELLEDNINAKLSSMLQYILCVSRFAHYIKVIGREKIGSLNSAEACQRDLQLWLHQYTTASEVSSDDVRSQYPLRNAQVQVKEMRGKPGHFYSIIQLQPHFQLDQMVSSIKLVTELTSRN
ncbi:type VI secretion system contractile sheath large subunit [Shewanella sp. 1_MG-2023]|uniref:type VI secretion system contractile sheath large subunit n=1 Tax=unclassified Shewanella TaxID=196818 RepID=UPI000C841FFB|nr:MULTISPECIES: type VI secretion system contractile sheath large subunit [unclassified Shewanella]MDO6610163.1 type VI secretion system contractile sheath large subunit [Shewanella sp. 7_MG-2023]MDO6769695.1 type VI secretion system contractile sheath large subunit [Shewanella sp. 2_MG-2023]MDO6792759.1 type VI secretion system contractile sheath large subunit [Shewanella sp. 1_MG-2023]PMG73018.1 type VI secretion protein [Shewanella sp. 10N.286.51.B7]